VVFVEVALPMAGGSKAGSGGLSRVGSSSPVSGMVGALSRRKRLPPLSLTSSMFRANPFMGRCMAKVTRKLEKGWDFKIVLSNEKVTVSAFKRNSAPPELQCYIYGNLSPFLPEFLRLTMRLCLGKKALDDFRYDTLSSDLPVIPWNFSDQGSRTFVFRKDPLGRYIVLHNTVVMDAPLEAFRTLDIASRLFRVGWTLDEYQNIYSNHVSLPTLSE